MRRLLATVALLLLASLAEAAAVTHRISTPDTGNTPNTSGAFIPASNDLLIVWVQVADSADTGEGSLTSSVGLGFILNQTAAYNSSTYKLFCYVSTALVTNTSSQTVTWDGVSDEGTGSIISVYSVSGMSRTGLNAILQTGRQQNQAASGTPAPAFAASADTNNATMGAVANLTSPAGLTPPTDWVEGNDSGHGAPASGLEAVSRASGFTGTTITWGSTSASAFASIIIELDTSVPAGCGTTIPLTGAGCK